MSFELPPDDLVLLNRFGVVTKVLAGTAHDVNNALHIIDASAEMLEQGAAGSNGLESFLRRIRTQSARVGAGIGEVMQLVRPGETRRVPVALRDVAARAVAMRAYQIRRAGLTLDFDATAQPATLVTGHVLQLLQVALNLLINAEQAAARQSGGALALEVREEESDVLLHVIDNGPGMAADLGDRAFDAFVTTHPAPDSAGLGLTASRIIARAHGGDVTLAERSPGVCATLRLPATAGSR